MMVTFIAHHAGQRHRDVVEVLGEDDGIVCAYRTLIGASVLDGELLIGGLGISHDVGHRSCLHDHLVLCLQIEVLSGAGQQTDALGVGAVRQNIEVGNEILSVFGNLI